MELSLRFQYQSFAKFNIYLGVHAKRSDGYHELDTAIQTIDLCDELEFEPLENSCLKVESNGDGVPSGSENLVWKALALVQEQFHPPGGMAVSIRKHIPAQAGLGGGSSNAACAICVANTLWNLRLDQTQLERVGAMVGSDVPFFIQGGTQRCQGRGEILTNLTPMIDSDWIVVKAPFSLSTRSVFNRVRSILTPRNATISIILESLAKRNLLEVVDNSFNDLEGPAGELQPQLTEVWQWMLRKGLIGVRLAGSGSACIGLCPNAEMTDHILEDGRMQGWAVHHVRPVARGWMKR